jgi:hypothetical protein
MFFLDRVVIIENIPVFRGDECLFYLMDHFISDKESVFGKLLVHSDDLTDPKTA